MTVEKVPAVSVLMSVYKEKPEWLEESINSILNQTFKDFEFIIINDNPEGVEQKEVLDKYQKLDDRIIVVQNPHNIGLTKSLNIGLKLARGKYIARMDADDISLPSRFEKQVECMDKDESIGIVGSWIEHFGLKSKIEKKSENDYELKIDMFFSAPFDHPATMMRKSVLVANGITYDETLRYSQDRMLWFEMSKFSSFYNIQEVLFKHRSNEGQVSCLHRREQLNYASQVRRLQIEYYLRCLKFSEINLSQIDVSCISKIRRYRDLNKLEQIDILKLNKIVNILFLSLKSYDFLSLMYFLFSFEYLRVGWKMKDFARVLYKFFRPLSLIRGGIAIQ